MDSAEEVGSVETEEWFLAQISREPIPVDELLQFLRRSAANVGIEQVGTWSDLLVESLIERGQSIAALRVLREQAADIKTSPEELTRARENAARALEPLKDKKGFIQHCGFDRGLAPAECLRRLLLLLDLKEGVLCLDKTWGFGLVQSVDAFYARVEINFEKKPRHTMSLAYAAEALQLLNPGHLFARMHQDPAGMRSLVENDPAEIVRITIRSYGPVTVSQLQEILSPKIVPADAWKGFWEVARRGLKSDPLVEIPTKRTEPIRLLESEKRHDAKWFASLAAERDMGTVLARISELVSGEVSLDDQTRRVAGERLAFVVKGAGWRHPGLRTRAVIEAKALGVGVDQVNIAEYAENLLKPELFLAVIVDLPARYIDRLVQLLAEHDKDRTIALLISLLNRINLVTLNAAVEFLLAQGAESRCADVMRGAFASQKAEVEMVYWISRNLDRLATWSLGTAPGLANLMLNELDKDYSGERLKAQNQLRSRFEQPELLKIILEAMHDGQRRETIQRIKDCPAWSSLDRQSLLGQIVKAYPELVSVLSTRTEDKPGAKRQGPLTSNRSYRERQALLQKIVEVEIPQNSREIAVARSYGDLSENHEYKAAKEMQGILLRRRGDFEDMLQRVRPSDFRDFAHDRVGLATGVQLKYPDGKTETYYILGEWDQDVALGIISCDTKLAQALQGHKVGEHVTIPTENGTAVCEIAEVSGLPPSVREWIEG